MQVEVYSGHTYAQEPRAFVWQGARYVVAEIEERWRTPEGPAFRLCAELTGPTSGPYAGSQGRFELHYHELEDHWVIRYPEPRQTVGEKKEIRY